MACDNATCFPIFVNLCILYYHLLFRISLIVCLITFLAYFNPLVFPVLCWIVIMCTCRTSPCPCQNNPTFGPSTLSDNRRGGVGHVGVVQQPSCVELTIHGHRVCDVSLWSWPTETMKDPASITPSFHCLVDHHHRGTPTPLQCGQVNFPRASKETTASF